VRRPPPPWLRILRERSFRLRLRAIQKLDRLRLRRLAARHPGLSVDPGASSNLAVARYSLAPGSTLRIAAGVVTEHLPGRLHFLLSPGAHVEIGEGTWLRTEMGDLYLVAFDDAHLAIGPEGFLNGCHISAKTRVVLGRRVWVGMGSRVFDADQHDLDDARPERCAPVSIGDCVWVGSDATVLRGVQIGEHSVVGARSLVTHDVPPHTLVHGQPARPQGPVGDRSRTR
jgi:acetyltransferase-like isoleucine patch superfamily enzyme